MLAEPAASGIMDRDRQYPIPEMAVNESEESRGEVRLRISPNAHACRCVVVQGLFGFRQRRILRADRYAMGPVGRADGDVTGIATKTAAKLRVANNNQRTGFWHPVEIGDNRSCCRPLSISPSFRLLLLGYKGRTQAADEFRPGACSAQPSLPK